MPVAILYSEGLKEYDFGPGHPFRGDRYEIFPRFLMEHLPENDNYRMLKAEPVTGEDLLMICRRDYIEFTRNYFRAANSGLSYPGQFFQYHSADNMPAGRPGKIEEAARLIVGQVKEACNLVQQGKYNKVISLGGGVHHAKPSYGEGFCIYNDVAFGAVYLMRKFGLERILILDTDAHAGNGTCEYFYEESKVLFIDLHQDPHTLYPGTGFAYEIGAGKGKGFTINIPMPVNADYDCYKLVFETIVQPVAKEYRPQIIIRNGGSDPHVNDTLTSLGLSVKGFRMIGEKVREIAEVCDGKVIDLIASGYNKTVLPYAWMALISGLTGFDVPVDEPEPLRIRFGGERVFNQTQKVVEEVKKYHKEYWNCFR